MSHNRYEGSACSRGRKSEKTDRSGRRNDVCKGICALLLVVLLWPLGASALAAAGAIYMDQLMGTEDAVEGLRAFQEKRKPTWKNR